MCFSFFKKPESAVIKPFGTKGISIMSSILLDVLESLNDQAELYLPDDVMKIYRKSDVMSAYELEEVASITYVAEEYDCDDFAAQLFGKFAGLLWTNVHALNWFVDENSEFWFIEPQTKKLAKVLEDWQGSDIRFFLGR